MLEIIALIFLARGTAKNAKGKGRSGGWAALPVGMWVGLELLVIAILAADGSDQLVLAGGGFISGIVGGLIGYLIVRSLPAQETQEQRLDLSVFE